MLDLAKLRQQNIRRCVSVTGFNHPLSSWSVAEWTNAMAGEAGEACNIAKKLIRFRDGVRDNKEPQDVLLNKLMYELADTVIYADLCAASTNQQLEEFIIRAFNDKSKEIGCDIFI
jgi:hypothetical protein